MTELPTDRLVDCLTGRLNDWTDSLVVWLTGD